jgi:hypothetical protein
MAGFLAAPAPMAEFSSTQTAPLAGSLMSFNPLEHVAGPSNPANPTG